MNQSVAKEHKRTFDYDFYRSVYNISCFIRELDGFFTYLLGMTCPHD